MKEKNKAGRKNRYEEYVKPNLTQITMDIRYEKKTEAQICKDLGIGISTFERYKREYPELKKAIKDGHVSFLNEKTFSSEIKAIEQKIELTAESLKLLIEKYKGDIECIAFSSGHPARRIYRLINEFNLSDFYNQTNNTPVDITRTLLKNF